VLPVAYRIAAPPEHDDSRFRKASGAIQRREFALRDPYRTEPATSVHAAMVVDGTALLAAGAEE
jgi:hypothetical protein